MVAQSDLFMQAPTWIGRHYQQALLPTDRIEVAAYAYCTKPELRQQIGELYGMAEHNYFWIPDHGGLTNMSGRNLFELLFFNGNKSMQPINQYYQ